MAKEQGKAQYALVDNAGEIQAIILTRGSEFYCFERLEDAPGNLKEARVLYPDCEVIGLQMKAEPKVILRESAPATSLQRTSAAGARA